MKKEVSKRITACKDAVRKISMKKAGIISAISSFLFIASMKVLYAAGETGVTPPSASEAKWQTVIDFLGDWIRRMGGAFIIVGLITFGFSWKEDNAAGKTVGLNTIIGGCIVFAVGASMWLFLE